MKESIIERIRETKPGETICLDHEECEAILILIEGKTGEWKRMSDLPIEIDDRFECSICGNIIHYHDRINLYTFNDYCGRCGAYNGFKFKDGEQE